MNNATRLIKQSNPRAAITATAPQNRPTRKDGYVLELILTTFGASNVLKAIAEMSSKPEVMRFADDLPKIKQNENRLEVCAHYRQFLESFLMACGVIVTLQTLLKACSNRVYLNQKQEKTTPFVGTWLATKRVIHMTIAAMTTDIDPGADKDQDADLKELARAVEQMPRGKARLETFIDRREQ